MKVKESLTLRLIVFFSVLIFAVVVQWSQLKYQLPGSDEYFQALLVRDYKSSFIAPLSFYIGYMWCHIFGETIYNLRVLAFLSLELSLFMGICFYVSRTKKLISGAFLFLIITFAINIGSTFERCHNIYNWDCAPYPFLSGVILAIISYVNKASRTNTIIIGVLTGCLVAARITYLVIPLIYLIVIIYVNHSHWSKIVIDFLLMILSMLAIYSLLIILIFGSLSNFLTIINAENTISGHSDIRQLLIGYVNVLPLVFRYYYPGLLCIISGIFLFWLRSKYNLSSLSDILLNLLFGVIGFIGFISIYYPDRLSIGFIQLPMFILIGCGLFRFYSIPSLRSRSGIGINLYILLTFSLIPTIGSDVGLLRIFAFPLIPILLANPVFKDTQSLLKSCIKIFGLTTIIIWFFTCSSRWANNTTSNFARLYGLRLSISESESINCIHNFSTQKSTAYVGMNKYAFDYLLSDSVGYNLQQYHYYNDDILIEKDAQRLSKYNNIVLIFEPTSPVLHKYIILLNKMGFEIKNQQDPYTIMESNNIRYHENSLCN